MKDEKLKFNTEPTPFPQRPLSKREMANWMTCSVRKLDRLMADKQIPFFRIGGRVAFDLSVVQEHFRQRCRVGGK